MTKPTDIAAAINLFLSRNIGVELRKTGSPFLMSRHATRFLYFVKRYYDSFGLNSSIVECGIGHGWGLLAWLYLTREIGPERQIFGFDTFTGFPDIHEKDGDIESIGKGPGYLAVSEKEVREYLWRSGFELVEVDKRVHLVPGDVRETLPAWRDRIGPISILNIDLDLYAGYVATLATLYEKVEAGGVIMFDEYADTKFPGPKRAINEFFGDEISAVRYDEPAGKYYMIKPS